AAEVGELKRDAVMHAYWGPAFDEADCERALRPAKGITYRKLGKVATETAELLAAGMVIGWFQGRMEIGPRALGNRSILADPRRQDMKDLLNHRRKKRAPFRPLSPALL